MVYYVGDVDLFGVGFVVDVVYLGCWLKWGVVVFFFVFDYIGESGSL